MPNIKVTYIINVRPGMRITRIKMNNVVVKGAAVPAAVDNVVKGDLTFFLGMEDYFEFTMDGVGDIIAGNSIGSLNFEYKGSKVMKNDVEFTVRNGFINVYIPTVKLP